MRCYICDYCEETDTAPSRTMVYFNDDPTRVMCSECADEILEINSVFEDPEDEFIPLPFR